MLIPININQTHSNELKKTIFVTAIMVLFALGIIFGEMYTDLDRISKIVGGLATAISSILGFKILWPSIKKKKYLLSTTLIFIISSNLLYIAEINDVITYLIYNISTILTMIILYSYNKKQKE